MKKSVLVGWVLSALVAAFLIIGSASGKFTEWEGKEAMFSHLGWATELMTTIGIIEVLLAILFLIPRVDIFAALFLTAYLGGAVATHVRVGDAFYFPIVLGVIIWVALILRRPVLKGVFLSR